MAESYICEKCKQSKFYGDFSKIRSGGINPICKVCMSLPPPAVVKAVEMKKSPKPKPKTKKQYMTPEERRRYQACRKYNLTHEEYDELLKQTVCLICGESGTLNIDHCHTTGKVRGRLCNSCNLGLGRFRDNPELLRRAAKYLEEKSDPS